MNPVQPLGQSRTLVFLAYPQMGLLDLTGYWQATEQFSVNAGLFNLGDKQYWQWGDVRSLTENSASLGR